MNKIAWFAFLALSWAAGTLPAHAQFYSLEGRYECLGKPDTVCFDATPDAPPAEEPQVSLAAAGPSGPSTPPAQRAHEKTADVIKAIDVPRTLGQDMSARFRAGAPTADDVATLRRAARAGTGWALELLAWCNLIGLGTPRDPVQAYLLYRTAAIMGVGNAERNRAIVYENHLTPEQRHAALMIENDVLLPPPEQRATQPVAAAMTASP